ncbi:MAG: hypothetical protein H2069_00640 [Legionella sp.]|nr:hypothetical protein [Legionella sp.]
MQGHLVKEKLPPVSIAMPKVSKTAIFKYNHIQNTSGLPLVDKKIRDILDDMAEFDVQYFDHLLNAKMELLKTIK